MKTKGMISRIVCIIFSALVYISLAFTFIGVKTEIGNKSTIDEVTFSDWWDSVDIFNKLKLDASTWWIIAQVLYVILFVVVGLLIVGTIIQFFVKNKYLNLAVKITGILTLIVAILAAIFNILGQIGITNQMSTLVEVSSFVPHVGMVVMAVAGIAAGALGIVCGKKLKKR